ncbi:hypothetical protein C5C36_13990 [Rathayibacter sp. AY1G1]|nr:histone-like nucleoid-structuring protein Lsr2 [Rathayibacter sp. AY1G1]PPH10477.1 hypothetical protein C5C36_13990 [Rathayibacter sp. AY1G1]
MEQKLFLIDDLDGFLIEDDGGTIAFSVDGANFEVDLSERNTAELRRVFEGYFSAGRPVRGISTPATFSARGKSNPNAWRPFGTGPLNTVMRCRLAAESPHPSRKRTTPPTKSGV